MTVDSLTDHWLVEAKTVGPNAEIAVREAIGQLLSYRHFCYRDLGRPDPRLVALFSEPVGEAFAELIVSLGIESIWREPGGWSGRSPDGYIGLVEEVDGRRAAASRDSAQGKARQECSM